MPRTLRRILSVGAQRNNNGSLKLDYIQNCAREIGEGLKLKASYHVVVARSTMLPGTVEEVIIREDDPTWWGSAITKH